MPAQCWGSTDRDGAQQPPLPKTQDMVLRQRLSVQPDDISDAVGGPWVSGLRVHASIAQQFQWVFALRDQVRGHVQVALRAADRRMAQQDLNHPQVRALFHL